MEGSLVVRPPEHRPDAEIIPPDSVGVDYWGHPITSADRQTVFAPEGSTLEAAVGHLIPPGLDAHAMVNGALIAQSEWGGVVLRRDDIVQVRVRVHGGGGGGSNPIAIILTIAVIIAAPYLAAALAPALGIGAGIGLTALTLGIQFAGLLIVNALFPPRLPDPPQIGGTGQPPPQYSLQGGSNRIRQHEPLLMLLGQHRMYPDIVAAEYTEYDENSDQFLNGIYDFGIGNLELGGPRYGETPLANFESVTTQSQVNKITLVAGNVDTIQGGEFEAAYPNGRATGSPWITRRTAGKTTAIAFDLVSMHFNANNKGKLEGRTAFFRIEWKKTSDSGWTGRNVDIESPDGADARNAVRRTVGTGRIDAAAYDVRVKIRANYDEDDDLSRITYRAAAPTIKAYQDETADFTGRNPLAIRAKATGQLYGRLDRVNADVGARIPDWDGTDWSTTRVSSNPASILLWWLRGYRVYGTLRAGYGLTDAQIDFASLQRWHVFCAQQGLECNIVLSDTRNEDEIAMLIAQCGWGRLDISTGRYGVVFENDDEAVGAIVNPANIVAGSIAVSYDNENLADEIIGTYLDKDSDYQENTLRRDVPQFAITGEFPVTIRLEGITNGEQAAKEINRAAAAQFYHQRQIVWEMDDEGRTIGIGDVVGMANGLIGNGQGGRLLSIAADRRTLGVPFDVRSASGSCWVWQLDDSVLSTTWTRTDDQEIMLGAALAAAPMEVDDHPTAYRIMLFAPTDPYTKVRITGIDATGPHRFRFTARDELQQYYDFRHSDLTAPLIPIKAANRPCATGFVVTETDLGERVFTWAEPEEPHTGFQIRYGAVGAEFSAMRDLHDGLLPGSPWTSLDAPDEGHWRFGLATIYPDGRRCSVVYADATLGAVARGLDGTDGNGIEDIFAATDLLTIPEGLRPLNTWGFDFVMANPQTLTVGSGDSARSLTWHDGLAGTGFGEDAPYLWRVTRRVPGTPAVGADIDAAWADTYRRAGRTDDPPSGDWEQPHIIGRWAIDGEQGPQGIAGADGTDGQPGADGADGEEGQGVEYIFAVTAKSVASIPSNQRPSNTWAYDTPGASGGLNWRDGAPELTDALPKLWRSERNVPGSPAAGAAKEATWSDWSVPVVVGNLGRGVEYIFARTAGLTLAANQRPDNAWGFDNGGTAGGLAWTDAAPGVNADFPYLWSAQREVVGVPAVGAAVTAPWSAPVIVGRFAVDGEQGPQGVAGGDGQDGQPGADGADGREGQGVEYVFAVTAADVTSLPASVWPDNSWGYDAPRTAGA